jgi:hypothetical protein
MGAEVLESVRVEITEDMRVERGRLRALNEAIERLREAYWRALEQGPRDVAITLALIARSPR